MVHATNNLTCPIVHASFSYLPQDYYVYSICPNVIFQILLPPSRPMTSHHVISHVTSTSCAPLPFIKEKKRKIKIKLLYNQKK